MIPRRPLASSAARSRARASASSRTGWNGTTCRYRPNSTSGPRRKFVNEARMRVDFTKAVTKVLERDNRSLLLSGDLGFSAFEELAATLGKRFLNAGVAEQNMVA